MNSTSDPLIRIAYSNWPTYNAALRDVVHCLTPEHLAFAPSPSKWPLWAQVGHLACQRVSWLCGFLQEPGGEDTPFPDALYVCPGDEDLEHVLGPQALVLALDSTFEIVERCLDTWTFSMLGETIRHKFGDEEWVYTRGNVIQRVFAHDITHIAEINERLEMIGVSPANLWA
ncbi:MAG TPA: DinB family protein [Anaerolineae bacterium]|nr:DinB family protein [Anaerolineae bacterium]HQI85569.1 DinB family protein [Anaerolineae bacterium]